MRFRPAGLAGAALAAAVAFAAAPAHAAFTVTLDSTAPSGPSTVYNYAASITPDDALTAGSFFRIYDFAGFVAAAAPADWTVSTSLVNATPPPNVLLAHGDDPALVNLTFTYNGATVAGPLKLTGFAVTTALGSLTTTKDFVGRVTKRVGPAPGVLVDSVGDVQVPTVPEPAGVVSAALGLTLCGGAYGLRARSRRAGA